MRTYRKLLNRFLIDHGVKKGFEIRKRDGEQALHREVKGF